MSFRSLHTFICLFHHFGATLLFLDPFLGVSKSTLFTTSVKLIVFDHYFQILPLFHWKSGFWQAILPKTDIFVKRAPRKARRISQKGSIKWSKWPFLTPFWPFLTPFFHPLAGLARPAKIAPRKPRDISYLISPFCHNGKRVKKGGPKWPLFRNFRHKDGKRGQKRRSYFDPFLDPFLDPLCAK